MSRVEFMMELRNNLSKLPAEELENAVRYYVEYFDDAGPENEQKVLSELGNPQKIATQILAEYAVKDLQQYPPKTVKKGLSAVWIVLLAIFALPIGLPVACVLFALALAVATVAFSIFVAFGAIMVSFFAAGLAVFIAGCMTVVISAPTGLTMIGSGLVLLGLGLLLITPLIALGRSMVSGLVKMFAGIGQKLSKNKKRI